MNDNNFIITKNDSKICFRLCNGMAYMYILMKMELAVNLINSRRNSTIGVG